MRAERTRAELLTECRDRGVWGYSRLDKPGLIEKLRQQDEFDAWERDLDNLKATPRRCEEFDRDKCSLFCPRNPYAQAYYERINREKLTGECGIVQERRAFADDYLRDVAEERLRVFKQAVHALCQEIFPRVREKYWIAALYRVADDWRGWNDDGST